MKQIEIKIHSFIDIITNSSTEIYVSMGSNSIKTIKTLINGLLKIAKSDKTCDDLFEISINNWKQEEWINDKIYKYFMQNDIMSYETYEQLNYEEVYSIYTEKTGKTIEDLKDEYYHDEFYDESTLVVKSIIDDDISKEVADILSNLQNIFNIDAEC